MPHIDEGELHALLDGAYAHDAPAAARIREEIATCVECRTRFDEAQALRMRAGAILNRALPHSSTPSFEGVLERAEVVSAPRQFRLPGAARLAWAATIVLALGIGWFGRDRLYSPKSNAPAELDAAARTQTPSAPAGAPLTEPSVVAPPAPQPNPAQSVAALPPSAGVSRDVAVGSAATGNTQGRVGNAAADEQRAKTPERRAEKAVAQSARDLVAIRADTPRERALERKAEGALSAAATTDSVQWQYGTVDDAERTTGRRVQLVPGLEVVNVGVSRTGERYITRATQRLPDGNTIEIVQAPRVETDQRAANEAAAPPAAAQPFTKDATGATVLTFMRSEWVFTGRATLSGDSLRALLSRVR